MRQVLDPATEGIRGVAGSGQAGFADGAGGVGRLSEPGGLAAGPRGTLYVADTNNSVIRSPVSLSLSLSLSLCVCVSLSLPPSLSFPH
jgi:hypothetical protein